MIRFSIEGENYKLKNGRIRPLTPFAEACEKLYSILSVSTDAPDKEIIFFNAELKPLGAIIIEATTTDDRRPDPPNVIY